MDKVKFGSIITAFLLLAGTVWAATSDTHIVTFDVGGKLPFIVSVQIGVSINPTEDTYTDTTFWFIAEDGDGNGGFDDHLDDSTADLYVENGGTVRTKTGACTPVDIGTNQTNYTCTVRTWYFDVPGTWNVNATVDDLSGDTAYNDTTDATMNTLSAMKMSPTSISFGTVNSGNSDVAATNDPITLNNTGNANFGTVNQTGIDLAGTTTPSIQQTVANMSVNIVDAQGGDRMSNNTAVTVTGGVLNRGNHSVNDGSTGQEQLYYYIEEVLPTLTQQTYDTSTNGQWTVLVTT